MTATMEIPTTTTPYKRTAKQDIFLALGIGLGITVLTTAIAILAGWATWDNLNWFEVAAVFTSYWCTLLCVFQRRFNYFVGLGTTAIYFFVFWDAALFSSAILQVYLIPTVIYGLFRWGKDDNTRPVENVQWKWLPVYLGVTGAFYVGALLITTSLGGAVPLIDSIILAGTILAQFLMDNKKLQSWFVWMGVNVISIWLYFDQGLYLAGLQYTLFLINAVFALVQWRKTMVR